MGHKRVQFDRSNPVARHARTYNKAVTMVDRKKAMKAGKTKHRSKWV